MVQSKQDLICHVAKVKVARSTNFMDDVEPFFSVFSNSYRVDKAIEKYILHTIKETISLTLSVYLGFNKIWRVNITDCLIQSLPSGSEVCVW